MDLFRRQDSRFMESAYKQVKVLRNGDHCKQVELTIKPGTTYQQLRDEVLSKLGLRDTGSFKLYTNEGVELYEDCLPLIRNEDRLFASLGEDFDQNTILAEYKEIKMLGEGGFGKVLLMEHAATEKEYAVKYVDARKYGLASLIDMVFKEAELLKNINHKHIVDIVNFFALKDMRVIFVMEYLQGGELGEFLQKKGKLEEEEAREIFVQLADAVNFCHMNNIIHRDLKLENILFESTESKNIKVVDFGIAGFYSNQKGSESSAGSLRYMAPEVLNGRNKAANPAIDVWSMGVILHTLLHGSLPFDGKNRKEIIEKIVYGKYQIAPEVKKKLSLECQDLLSRMLIVDYKNRINTYEIMDHPWVRGEKNVFSPLWYYDDDSIDKAVGIENKTNLLKTTSTTTKSNGLSQFAGGHVKSKGSVGNGSDKDVFPRIAALNNTGGMHRKSNSRDQAMMKELVIPKEKKSLMYEEGKRRDKRLLTSTGFEKEEPVKFGMLQRVKTENKISFPTIPTSTTNSGRLQSKHSKKNLF